MELHLPVLFTIYRVCLLVRITCSLMRHEIFWFCCLFEVSNYSTSHFRVTSGLRTYVQHTPVVFGCVRRQHFQFLLGFFIFTSENHVSKLSKLFTLFWFSVEISDHIISPTMFDLNISFLNLVSKKEISNI
jgi:hypothetical protein